MGTDAWDNSSYPSDLDLDGIPDLIDPDIDGDGYDNTLENSSGSDSHDNRSTPNDWDGDGVVNWEDDYPLDGSRWKREDETRTNIVLILIYITIGFILILTALMWYTRHNGKKILKNSNTMAVLACINTNPGLHYRGLKTKMGMGGGALRHHIQKLTGNDYIQTVKVSKYKFFYPMNYGNIKPLSPMEKEIVRFLGKRKRKTIQEIAKILRKKRPTVHYHLSNLADRGILEGDKVGFRKFWHMK